MILHLNKQRLLSKRCRRVWKENLSIRERCTRLCSTSTSMPQLLMWQSSINHVLLLLSGQECERLFRLVTDPDLRIPTYPVLEGVCIATSWGNVGGLCPSHWTKLCLFAYSSYAAQADNLLACLESLRNLRQLGASDTGHYNYHHELRILPWSLQIVCTEPKVNHPRL